MRQLLKLLFMYTFLSPVDLALFLIALLFVRFFGPDVGWFWGVILAVGLAEAVEWAECDQEH